MSGDADILLAEMRRRGGASFGPAEILSLARPLFERVPDLRGHVGTLLEELARANAVRLPSQANKARWDRSAQPPLPLQTVLRAGRRPPRERATTTWSDAFSFAANVNASEKRDALVRVNDWHRVNRGARPRLVPYRVRSAQILGDEKAFDALGLVQGTTLCGHAPLSLIGAYNPDLPLAREDAGKGPGTVLVVENAHAYSLIADINREVGAYRSVIWGGGARVMKRAVSALSLTKAMETCGAGGVTYVGDVDPEGIRIAAGLAQEIAPAGLRLKPALPFYERMLRLPAFPNARRQADVGDAIEWLPSGMREDALRLFAEGKRVAQEIMDEGDVMAALLAPDASDDRTEVCPYRVVVAGASAA